MEGGPRQASSGATGRGQAAEPALAPAILRYCAFKRGAVEIRPVDRDKNEFAVGGLPQKEIRQSLFAAGPDDEVGVRQIRCIEGGGDPFSRDGVGGQAA